MQWNVISIVTCLQLIFLLNRVCHSFLGIVLDVLLPTYSVLPMICFLSYASCAVLRMLCFLCCASYAMSPML